MMKKFDILCGGIGAPRGDADKTIQMDVQGKAHNVNLKIEDISRAVMGNVPDILLDLLEVAAYVYCADQRLTRGQPTLSGWGKTWRRELRFTIPVRHPDIWERPEVKGPLTRTLGFLSDDIYDFSFAPATHPFAEKALYFSSLTDAIFAPDEIALFSGGVDSCAGAVEDLVQGGKSLALIGHHSASKVFNVQKALIDDLRASGFDRKIFYVPVNVTNDGVNAREYTQRTRSFLFAVLALVVARMFGRDSFTFYENGVVSINLGFTQDILGARATRTTHPKALRGFEEIFSGLTERSVSIRTPLLWQTKREVTGKLAACGFERLLMKTASCTRPRQWTTTRHHCGVCSQCIDRRFAVLAAGMAAHDPADNYGVDLLTGVRDAEDSLQMAVAYVRFFQAVKATPRERFLSAYSQLASAINHIPGLSAGEATNRIYDLYQRHADDVLAVIDAGVKQHSQALLQGEIPTSALLSLCFNRGQIEIAPVKDYDRQVKAFMDRLGAPVLEFGFDEAAKRVLFHGGHYLDGANFRVVEALIENFRSAKKRRADVAFLPTTELADRLDVSDQAMRQQLGRLRKALEPLTVTLGIPLDQDTFIQTKERAGYRLNPEWREVSVGDIRIDDGGTSQA